MTKGQLTKLHKKFKVGDIVRFDKIMTKETHGEFNCQAKITRLSKKLGILVVEFIDEPKYRFAPIYDDDFLECLTMVHKGKPKKDYCPTCYQGWPEA